MSQDIQWVRGQDEEWSIAVTNTDGTADNLSTALAIDFEVKKYDGRADPADLHLALGAGVTLRTQTGQNVGLCDIVATAAQTFALAAGSWRYDVFVTRADGFRKRAQFGTLTVVDVVNFP